MTPLCFDFWVETVPCRTGVASTDCETIVTEDVNVVEPETKVRGSTTSTGIVEPGDVGTGEDDTRDEVTKTLEWDKWELVFDEHGAGTLDELFKFCTSPELGEGAATFDSTGSVAEVRLFRPGPESGLVAGLEITPGVDAGEPEGTLETA